MTVDDLLRELEGLPRDARIVATTGGLTAMGWPVWQRIEARRARSWNEEVEQPNEVELVLTDLEN